MSKFYGIIITANDIQQDADNSPFHFRNRFAEQFGKITYDACVVHGFCGSIRERRSWTVEQFIPKNGVLTAQQFAQLLLYAEQLNCSPFSGTYKTYGPPIERLFLKHFGRKTIHLSDLHSAVPGLGKHPSNSPPACFSRKLPKLREI